MRPLVAGNSAALDVRVSRWDISRTRDLKFMPNHLFPKIIFDISGGSDVTDGQSSVDVSDRLGFIQLLSFKTSAQSGCFSVRPTSSWDGLIITCFS